MFDVFLFPETHLRTVHNKPKSPNSRSHKYNAETDSVLFPEVVQQTHLNMYDTTHKHILDRRFRLREVIFLLSVCV